MTEQKNEHPVSTVESLPADSSWWTFFKTDFFGKNYCNFKGRASRKEFWATSVLGMLFYFIIGLVSFIIGLGGEIISLILFLYFLVPDLAIIVRRFHDINWSGRWALPFFLIFLAPVYSVFFSIIGFENTKLILYIRAILGAIILIGGLIGAAVLPFFAGDKKDNKYGKNIYNDDTK